MVKFLCFLALVSLTFAFSFAENEVKQDAKEVEAATERNYYRWGGHPHPKACPCKCFFGHKKRIADKQCYSYIYKHCYVSTCYKKSHEYHYYPKAGKWCCDHKGEKPEPPKPKPCPCKCTTKGHANRACKYLHHCKVLGCHKDYLKKYGRNYDAHEEHEGYGGHGGYYKKRYYECCDAY